MKKALNIFLVVCALFAFTACGDANKSANDAEKQIAVQKEVAQLKEQVSVLKDKQDGVDHKTLEEKVQEKAIKAEVKSPVAEEKKAENSSGSISINAPKDGETLSKEPVNFSGIVTEGATKIVVTANSGTKNEDIYTLNNFKSGDKKFTYKASRNFKNMVNGSNTYEFTAYFKDGKTKSSKLTINFSK